MSCVNISEYEGIIIQLVTEGHTYNEISDYLTRRTGLTDSLSARTIRRHCSHIGVGFVGLLTKLD